QPEGDGRSWLQQRAAKHDSLNVILGEAAKRSERALVIGLENHTNLAQEHYQCGIRHVLAGSAPVYESGGFRIDRTNLSGEHLHHGNGGGPGPERETCKGGQVEALGARGGRNGG